MDNRIIGPDMGKLHSYRELPIGSTIIAPHATTVRTGSWRFYRPQARDGIPPCRLRCPAAVDVRGFISLVKKKRYQEAYRVYVIDNPFPSLCSALCDSPCQEGCVRGAEEAVEIHALEGFISQYGATELDYPPPQPTAKRVAVVGASIAVLAAVHFLRMLGHGVIVYPGLETDSLEKLLGSLGLSSEDLLRREVRQITKAGTLFEMIGAGVPDDMKNYDAVIWGLESNPTKILPGFFALKPQEETVAVSIGRGKKVAIATDLFLRGGPKSGTDPTSFSRYLATLKGEELLHQEPVQPEEIDRKGLEREDGIDSKSMRGPLSEDAALKAARRCFECGACTLCGHCVTFCPDQSVRLDLSLKRVVFDYDFCKGCGICVFECPRGALGFAKEEAVWR